MYDLSTSQAYAKFYGSYANIEGGVSLDAGVDFTGLKSSVVLRILLIKRGPKY